jgi:5-methylcytosine-specific restriction enzyme A
MAKRATLSTKDRLRIFNAAKGVCDICQGQIHTGELWEISHRIPLELGGADDDSNRFPAHKICHRSDTSTKDIPAIAKAKRREASHIGANASEGSIKSGPSENKRRRDEPVQVAAGMPNIYRRFR